MSIIFFNELNSVNYYHPIVSLNPNDTDKSGIMVCIKEIHNTFKKMDRIFSKLVATSYN